MLGLLPAPAPAEHSLQRPAQSEHSQPIKLWSGAKFTIAPQRPEASAQHPMALSQAHRQAVIMRPVMLQSRQGLLAMIKADFVQMEVVEQTAGRWPK